MSIRKILRIMAAVGVTVSCAVAVATTAATQSARAEDNGVGATPALGWSSWSFVRTHPTESGIEAQADAMKSSGLASVGYQYVNVDDFWYQCPGGQGPNVDSYGRWVIDPAKFPPAGGVNGITATANHVHSLGLKFGLYVTPGISRQAVAQNTPIEGTSYTADQIAEPSVNENNYNCGGMVGIDYTKPGAQQFINSWADELASWGVDYIKIDGVGSFDSADVVAWSNALQQTGRPIHLELSNSLNINDASTWQQYSNGWRTGGDIECYCGGSSSYPLTDWGNISQRFDTVAAWQPYGGPGAFNDEDSIEVGNGSNDGLTYDERQTQLSLWALASSPLILGTDLTNLDPTDLALLENKDVIAVDQDAIDASRLVDNANVQIFAKTEKGGDVDAGLFNTSSQTETISTTAAALGLPASESYLVNNLWTHAQTETTGAITFQVPSHGVALLQVSVLNNPTTAPPAATLTASGVSNLPGGQPTTATVSFTDNGELPAQDVKLALSVPSSWTATATSQSTFPAVENGQTVTATFQVTAPVPTSLFATNNVSATASYSWPGQTEQSQSLSLMATTSPPVQSPYKTYSSATDAPAVLGQLGQQFGISGAGADLYTGTDAYSTIYQPGAVGNTATVETEVTSQQALTGFGKAGIIVRNTMTGSGTTPEGVILFESPGEGIQLEWNDNGGNYIDNVTPGNGTNPELNPLWLELVRNGDSYTGYYSFDGSDWLKVGTATVPGQAATQDAGMFVTSHTAGSPAQVSFNGFTVSATAATPSLATAYQAATAGTLAGGANIATCSTCYGGEKVGFVGNGGTLTVSNITAPSAGTYNVTLIYCDGTGGTTGRQADVTVNGGTAQLVSFTPTGSFNTVGAITLRLSLNAGTNTIELSNPSAYAPDFNEIIVAAAPS